MKAKSQKAINIVKLKEITFYIQMFLFAFFIFAPLFDVFVITKYNNGALEATSYCSAATLMFGDRIITNNSMMLIKDVSSYLLSGYILILVSSLTFYLSKTLKYLNKNVGRIGELISIALVTLGTILISLSKDQIFDLIVKYFERGAKDNDILFYKQHSSFGVGVILMIIVGSLITLIMVFDFILSNKEEVKRVLIKDLKNKYFLRTQLITLVIVIVLGTSLLVPLINAIESRNLLRMFFILYLFLAMNVIHYQNNRYLKTIMLND